MSLTMMFLVVLLVSSLGLTLKNITETAVQQLSSFEHASMFVYTDQITRKLVERKYWPRLKDTMPAQNSAATFSSSVGLLLIFLSPLSPSQLPMHPLVALEAKTPPPPVCYLQQRYWCSITQRGSLGT
jgi:hypothetical protein